MLDHYSTDPGKQLALAHGSAMAATCDVHQVPSTSRSSTLARLKLPEVYQAPTELRPVRNT